MKYTYVALFEKEDDIYNISVPDLPGVISFGNSIQNSIEQVEDALGIWLVTAEDMKLEIKKASSFSELQSLLKSKDDFLQYITVDTEFVRRREENKSVKKTLTIPSWLNDIAVRKKINFSQILQEALKNELNV